MLACSWRAHSPSLQERMMTECEASAAWKQMARKASTQLAFSLSAWGASPWNNVTHIPVSPTVPHGHAQGSVSYVTLDPGK